MRFAFSWSSLFSQAAIRAPRGPVPFLAWGVLALDVAGTMLSGLFRYGESELDPSIQAEILLESARNEARVATLEVILAIAFWPLYGLKDTTAFSAVAIFCLITVLPLLIDSQLRRSAARRLLGHGPKPHQRR